MCVHVYIQYSDYYFVNIPYNLFGDDSHDMLAVNFDIRMDPDGDTS